MHRDTALAEVRHGQVGDPFRGGRLQVVAVRPRQLALVEHAGAVPHVLDREAARQFVDRQQLLVAIGAAGRPADERQVVHQRFRQIAPAAELGHRRRAVPLRQGRVVGPHDEREVREPGRLAPQRLVQQQLPRRIRDVILAPDDVRNLHQHVVDHDGEVVGGVPVGSQEHRIADHRRVEVDGPADEVVEHDLPSVGDPEPDHGPLAGGTPPRDLLRTQRPAGARVAGRASLESARACGQSPAPRACRSSSRPGRRQSAAPPGRRRSTAARTAGTARTGRRCRAPRPSRARATGDRPGSHRSDSRVDRSASVSSIRSTNVPPSPRANSQLNNAVRALPTWS